MSYLFITHDLTLVTSICDRVIVMYKGCEVESGYTADIFKNPKHPYTKLLLSCIMTVEKNQYVNMIPELNDTDNNYGCKFKHLCSEKMKKCYEEMPKIKNLENRNVRCHLY